MSDTNKKSEKDEFVPSISEELPDYDPSYLNDLLEAVCDKDTFLNYVSALGNDFFYEQQKLKRNPVPMLGAVQGPHGWYNHSIDGFLEAIVACADGRRDRFPEEPSWKTFAEMLDGGKIYE